MRDLNSVGKERERKEKGEEQFMLANERVIYVNTHVPLSSEKERRMGVKDLDTLLDGN